MKVKLEKIANIVTLSEVDCNGKFEQVIKSWYTQDYTERKLKNTLKKLAAANPNSDPIILI